MNAQKPTGSPAHLLTCSPAHLLTCAPALPAPGSAKMVRPGDCPEVGGYSWLYPIRPGECPEAVVGCVTYPKGGYRSTPPTEAREKPVFCARRAATSYIKTGFLRAFPGLFGQKVRGLSGTGPPPDGIGHPSDTPLPDIPRTFCPKSPGKARKRPGFIYDVAALRAQKPGFSRALSLSISASLRGGVGIKTANEQGWYLATCRQYWRRRPWPYNGREHVRGGNCAHRCRQGNTTSVHRSGRNWDNGNVVVIVQNSTLS